MNFFQEFIIWSDRSVMPIVLEKWKESKYINPLFYPNLFTNSDYLKIEFYFSLGSQTFYFNFFVGVKDLLK